MPLYMGKSNLKAQFIKDFTLVLMVLQQHIRMAKAKAIWDMKALQPL